MRENPILHSVDADILFSDTGFNDNNNWYYIRVYQNYVVGILNETENSMKPTSSAK